MMNFHNGKLHIQNVSTETLVQTYGTPLYVYDADELFVRCQRYQSLRAPYPIALRYAVKANPHLAILQSMYRAGFGFDIVSGGELDRVIRIGASPAEIVYSGVGKSIQELQKAIEVGVGCIHIESVQEVARIISLTQQAQKNQSIAIRINPQVDVHTHPYIATALETSKFGVFAHDLPEIFALLEKSRYCKLIGFACHLGSMIENITPVVDACEQLLSHASAYSLRKDIRHISIGGGLAVRYKDEHEQSPQELIDAITKRFGNQLLQDNLTLMLEPGRSIIAPVGILLSKVEYVKHNQACNFLVVDAAMNDLPRPSLYDAWHQVITTHQNYHNQQTYDIVGPICESGDCLARSRQLTAKAGDVVAFCTTGAYTYSMASNYNCRPRAAAVMVKNNQHFLITRREQYHDMLTNEIW